jgi:hypothetical protein
MKTGIEAGRIVPVTDFDFDAIDPAPVPMRDPHLADAYARVVGWITEARGARETVNRAHAVAWALNPIDTVRGYATTHRLNLANFHAATGRLRRDLGLGSGRRP